MPQIRRTTTREKEIAGKGLNRREYLTTQRMKKGFFNLIPNGDSCTILLFGLIGEYEEIRSSDIVRQLLEAEKLYKRIEIRINCPGGEVFTGIAIFNALRNLKTEVLIYVDGVAASMGAVLALCGHHVEASKYSKFMFHGASGGCWGNRKEIEKYLSQLEEIDNTLCRMLSDKCGKTEEEIREAYFDGQDHWFTAEEALALGFIDGIYDADPVTVPEDSSPEEIFAVFHNKYQYSLNQEEMFEKLKKMASFSDCADEVAVLKRIDEMKATADRVPGLEKEKTDLEALVDGYKQKETDAAAKAIEDYLDQAIKVDEKFGEDAREGYRAMLNADPVKGKAVIDAMPKKRKAIEDVDTGGGAPKKGAFEARMEEINKNNQKK